MFGWIERAKSHFQISNLILLKCFESNHYTSILHIYQDQNTQRWYKYMKNMSDQQLYKIFNLDNFLILVIRTFYICQKKDFCFYFATWLCLYLLDSYLTTAPFILILFYYVHKKRSNSKHTLILIVNSSIFMYL